MDHEFLAAVKSDNSEVAKALLAEDSSLAGKNFTPKNLHTDGFPIYHAAKHGNFELVKLLIKNGADPNANLKVDEPREKGMPLINALENGHFEVVHLLLDYNAETDAFPYCSTPFVDSICNAMWKEPESKLEVERLISESFNYYFTKRFDEDTSPHANDDNPSEMLKLLRRVIFIGGRPSLFTVVRHEHLDLIERLLRECPKRPGTPVDWPRGSVFENICKAARWCGYPDIVEKCRELCPALFTGDVAKQNIEAAIRSHNRDGGIDEYYQMIKSQLEFLKSRNEIAESYSNGDPLLPLHWLAEDFIEPKNYGFKCDALLTEPDIIRLAELFIEFGFKLTSTNSNGMTPFEIAKKEDLQQYVDFLREKEAKAL